MDSLTEAARVSWSVEESYEYCRNLARSHYENFTVGSWFLPREKRPNATPISNLFLAGEWVDTGWPGTMEGAVRSGQTAARALASREQEG